ncbi:phage holin family protein [Pseudomonas aeruginosa]
MTKFFLLAFGICGYFLGGWDATLKILVTMVVIDYLTGILRGYNGELKAKLVSKASPKVVLFFWSEQPLS